MPRAAIAVALGSGCGTHGSPSCGSAGGTGSRSNSTVARSTPATPSTSAWWVLEISAKRPSSSPCTSHSSHSGFVRSSRCEWIRAASARSCSSVPGSGSAGVAQVVLEVEARVVDPQRPAGLQRRDGELLPVARDEVQPAAHVVGEVGERRRRPLEDHHRADVHVRVLALLGEEGGVHRASADPRAPAPWSLLCRSERSASGERRREAGRDRDEQEHGEHRARSSRCGRARRTAGARRRGRRRRPARGSRPARPSGTAPLVPVADERERRRPR